MRLTLLALSVLLASGVQAAVRPAAMAGSFYPGNEQELRSQVEAMLAAAARPSAGRSVALVVPHAGYVFSGATAASGYATLAGARRVILLGPSHHYGYAGGALPATNVSAFATPLGRSLIDLKAVSRLRREQDFRGPSEAHDREHSLEVQLPFLQVVAPEARIVPVLIGVHSDRQQCQRIARSLAGLLDEQTVVIASSDFSHHGHGYGWSPFAGREGLGEILVDLARATAERAAAGDGRGFWQQVEVSGDTVCGARPVAVLTEIVAHGLEGRGEVLAVTTSGHVVKDWSRSVSYVTVGFHGSWRRWQDPDAAPDLGRLNGADREAVLGLARATLRSHLVHDHSLAGWFAEHPDPGLMLARSGAFVTVHNPPAKARRQGRLRACMGVIEAREPLLDAVIHAAVSAAHDPRFAPLGAAELAEVELEVSVLSPTHPVDSPEEIVVGRHGVLLTKGRRQAVFLPQVATEQGWDRETMLDQLALKAGLDAGAWRQGASFEVFEAQVFGEGE
jgi:AmmeMemoRadiSam system protein B/AmmeMemoRadiSam system protein A